MSAIKAVSCAGVGGGGAPNAGGVGCRCCCLNSSSLDLARTRAFSCTTHEPGRDVLLLASHRHSTPFRAANSIGSPTRLPLPLDEDADEGASSTRTREWHADSTRAASTHASRTATSEGKGEEDGEENDDDVDNEIDNEEGDKEEEEEGDGSSGFMTPTGTCWSVVSVPVLSNRQCVTFPAKGTRKGSVQKMPDLVSAIRAMFTAT